MGVVLERVAGPPGVLTPARVHRLHRRRLEAEGDRPRCVERGLGTHEVQHEVYLPRGVSLDLEGRGLVVRDPALVAVGEPAQPALRRAEPEVRDERPHLHGLVAERAAIPHLARAGRREAVEIAAADLGRAGVDVVGHRLGVRQHDPQTLDRGRLLGRERHRHLDHAVELGPHLARDRDVAQAARDVHDLAMVLVDAGLGLDARGRHVGAVGERGREPAGGCQDLVALGHDTGRKPGRADLHLPAPDAERAALERHRCPRRNHLLDAAAARLPPGVLGGQALLRERTLLADDNLAFGGQAVERDRVFARGQRLERNQGPGVGVGVDRGRRLLDRPAGGILDGDGDLLDRVTGVVVDEIAEDAGVVAFRVEGDAEVQHVAAILERLLGHGRKSSQRLPVEQRRPSGVAHGDPNVAGAGHVEVRKVDHVGEHALLDLGGAFLRDGVGCIAPSDLGVGLAAGGQMDPDLAGRRVAHPQQMQGRRGLRHDELAVGVDHRKRARALEGVLLPGPLVVAGNERAKMHPLVERPLGRAQAGPRDDEFHLPLVLRSEPALRLPVGVVAAGAGVAHRRLVDGVVAGPGEVAEELREAVGLAGERVGGADGDPDFVAIVVDDVEILADAAAAMHLQRPLARPQRVTHGDVDVLLVPHHPIAGLPRADLAVGGLERPLAERPLPLGVADHAVDRRLLPGVGDRDRGMGVELDAAGGWQPGRQGHQAPERRADAKPSVGGQAVEHHGLRTESGWEPMGHAAAMDTS